MDKIEAVELMERMIDVSDGRQKEAMEMALLALKHHEVNDSPKAKLVPFAFYWGDVVLLKTAPEHGATIVIGITLYQRDIEYLIRWPDGSIDTKFDFELIKAETHAVKK